MPELAEVEFYRRLWDPALGKKVLRAHLHSAKRIFRGTDPALIHRLAGETLIASEAAAKQMLFRFSGDLWLGIHLGMSGKLSLGPPGLIPGKHDHLVLFQRDHALVFNDARLFGRVLIHEGATPPDWWTAIAPAILSAAFTLRRMATFLARHGRMPIKPALLLQEGFPGIGNWMADEVLWRAQIDPRRLAGSLSQAELRVLRKQLRWGSRQALLNLRVDTADLPSNWLFHQRWSPRGICPRDRIPLTRETIGGRTTAWCPKCQL